MDTCLEAGVDAGVAPLHLRGVRLRWLRGWAGLAACAVWFAMAAPRAAAQNSAADKALAETLFDRGVALMRQGQFAQACSQLEQSETIERGIGTLLYLAECYEKLGRTASAWAMFREAASAARAEGQPDRAKTGNARADRLEPLLSKLTIHVATETAPPGLAVLRNGQAVPAGAWGQPIPVDPGEQRVEAKAPGYNAWAVSVNLPANAASLTVDVPALTADPTAAAPPPAAVAATSETAAPAVVAAPPAATAATSPRKWQRPVGLVVGAVGVVGVALGSYFGVRTISKSSASNKACGNQNGPCTNTVGVTDSTDAHTAATLANVFMIGGAALLAGGAVLYFTAPSEESLHLAVRGPGIEFGGTL